MTIVKLATRDLGRYVIKLISIDEKALKAAALEPNGEARAAEYHVAQLDRENRHSQTARLEIEDGRRSRENRIEDLKRCRRQIARTNPKRFTTTRKRHDGVQQSFFQSGLAIFFIFGAAASLVISNIVGSAFVVGSGNDLFALDPSGARAFYIVPVIAALGITTYEYCLRHDHDVFRYRSAFFLFGLIAFAIWAVAGAVTFAPTGGATNWAATGTTSMIMGGLLLLSHIFVDAAMGSVIFSAAVDLFLGDRVVQSADNPKYLKLKDEESSLEDEISQLDDAVGISEDYLSGLANARIALKGEVHFAFSFNAARHAGAQQAEAGKATLQYLTA